MSEFNEETVKVLTRLSRIEVLPDELHKLYSDLQNILHYFDQLQEVDLSNLSPYSHVEEQGIEALREDNVEESLILDRKDFLTNAPDHIGGMIRVPPVLKNNQ